MTLTDLEQKLSQNPSSPLFARLAKEYLTAGRVEEAMQLCVSGLQVYPSYATAHLVLAQCYHAEQNTTRALEYIQEARTFLPDSLYLKTLYDEWSNRVTGQPIEQSSFIATEEAEPIQEVETPPAEIVEEPLATAPRETPMEVMPLEVSAPLSPTIEEVLSNELAIAETIELPPAPVEEILPEPSVELLDTFIESPSTKILASPSPITEDRLSYELPIAETIELPPAPLEEILPEPPVEQFETFVETPSVEISEPPVTTTVTDVPVVQSDDDEGRIVTKTLAEIYVSQGAYAEAILTYQLLKILRPAQSAEYDLRIKELEQKLQDKPSLHSTDKSING